MEITGSLETAAIAAQSAVTSAAVRLAGAMTGPASTHDFEGPMKEAVRKELFAEALLGAAHSRLEEIKTATGER